VAQQLAGELTEIDKALRAIESRDIFKTADDLVQRDRAEKALAGAADQAIASAARDREGHARAVGDADRILDELRRAGRETAAALGAARTGLANAGLPCGNLPAGVRLAERTPASTTELIRTSRNRDPQPLVTAGGHPRRRDT